MKLDVIGFGALNVDTLYRVNRIAKEGEERFITAYQVASGGSAANTIVGLARLGARTGYIGKLSKDTNGKLLLQDLLDEHVNVDGVIVVEKGVSGVVHCFVDAGGERAMYVNPGVNDDLTRDELDLDYCRNTELLHLTTFIGKKPFEAQLNLVEDLTNTRISLDPGMFYVMKGFQVIRPLIQRCSLILLNEAELNLLTGEDCVGGAKTLITEGVEVVAVKLGQRGCYVTDGREAYLIDAYKANVVDTTGAGDAFGAGFLYGLLRGKDMYTCGKLGNFVASRKIEKQGARDGLPKREDLPTALL